MRLWGWWRRPAPPAPAPEPALAYEDRDAVIRTVYGEARGEGPAGQAAVVHVIRNRVQDRRWPDTPRAVCHQPRQFSCWNANDPNRARLLSLPETSDEYRAVGVLVDLAWVSADSTGGANHYYAPAGMPGGRAPSWAVGKKPVAMIGGHWFFRL